MINLSEILMEKIDIISIKQKYEVNDMEVQCALCDEIENIADYSLKARRLINQRNHAHLCPTCYERIKINTEKRHDSGKFQFYRGK